MQSDVVSLEEWRRVEKLHRAQPGSPGKLTHMDNGSPHRESIPCLWWERRNYAYRRYNSAREHPDPFTKGLQSRADSGPGKCRKPAFYTMCSMPT